MTGGTRPTAQLPIEFCRATSSMSQCWRFLLLFLPVAAIVTSERDYDATAQGSSAILVSSVGRPRFNFEIFLARNSIITSDPDRRLTSGASVNYNGQFIASSENAWIKLASGGSVCPEQLPSCKILAYVSEDEEGTPQIFFKEFKILQDGLIHEGPGLPWKLEGIKRPACVGWRSCSCNSQYSPFFQDRPSVANGTIIYVGMRKTCQLRQSWAAIFSRDLKLAGGGKDQLRCLTPEAVADFSPSVSPSGEWVLVASDQNHGFQGELCNINSDLYIFRAVDGSERHLLIENAGWPSWGATNSKIFFHRLTTDGWWSVYEASIMWYNGVPMATEQKRLTASGFHAFTPAASRDGKWIAFATRRPQLDYEIKYRRIEILDLALGETRILGSSTLKEHQYNPFIDPDDSTRIGYHRCGTEHEGRKELEALRSPVENISIHRITGDFGSFSNDGSFIAFNMDINSRKKGERGICVMHRDGSNKTSIFEPRKGRAFGTSWGKDLVVYSSYGEDAFMAGNTTTHIIAIYLNVIIVNNRKAPKLMEKHRVVRLTKDQLEGNSLYNNNAFPSASPDGKWIVFRSSRASDEQMGKTYYNLYAIDAEKGEFHGAKAVQLTSGKWTDTMCKWSPNGEWIAFASDREKPGSRKYAVYKMRWDEAKVKVAMQSNELENAVLQVTKVTNNEGIAVHPYFSPDSKRLVFATDNGGLSAEPISTPNMFQPYGEVYMCDLDNCSTTVHRMTWSPYETSLPAWGNGSVTPNEHSSVSSQGCSKSACKFSDGLSLGGESKMAQFCDLDNVLPHRESSFQPQELDDLETPENGLLCDRERSRNINNVDPAEW